MTLAPLNGRLTHPLTESGWHALAQVAAAPVPRQELNPGVANRLLRGNLAAQHLLPSPYKTHKGRPIAHLSATDFGREKLAQRAADLASRPTRPFPETLRGAAHYKRRPR
jgi:hypothetical protein